MIHKGIYCQGEPGSQGCLRCSDPYCEHECHNGRRARQRPTKFPPKPSVAKPKLRPGDFMPLRRDPPVSGTGVKRTNAQKKYSVAWSMCMADEGEWYQIDEGLRNTLSGVMAKLKNGQRGLPPGKWEFITRNLEEADVMGKTRCGLWARYLGTDE